VLRLDATHVAAYKNLGETLFAAGRFDAWRENFLRFETHCPDALALAVQALEVSQWHGDFARVGRYLDGLSRGAFRAADETELVDCLEELLYLLLFFDVAPEHMLRLARTYDTAARHVYGEPLPRPAKRKPGRLRIGYLSADLRNHVMGKMMWQAIQHHDRSRFEVGFYSLAAESDEWTERFRGAGDRFTLLAGPVGARCRGAHRR
jgi:predicted O-linked N-acetylglucosamine transferase (SPINDLY family)